MKIKPGFRITVACLIVILGDSCHNNLKANSKHKKTFFDSVAAQLDLSFKQVRRHTDIDSGYFTAKSKFTGDTIYYALSKFPLAIIRNEDGLVCSYKFLLVYNRHTRENTACYLVETDCDEDYGTDFSRLSFKIFNETQFFTREVTYTREQGKKTRVTVDDRFFQIDDKGKIERLKSAPAGVNVPVYVQPENIDDTADDSLNKSPQK